MDVFIHASFILSFHNRLKFLQIVLQHHFLLTRFKSKLIRSKVSKNRVRALISCRKRAETCFNVFTYLFSNVKSNEERNCINFLNIIHEKHPKRTEHKTRITCTTMRRTHIGSTNAVYPYTIQITNVLWLRLRRS